MNGAGVRDLKGEVVPRGLLPVSIPSPIMGFTSAGPDWEVDFRDVEYPRPCGNSAASSQRPLRRERGGTGGVFDFLDDSNRGMRLAKGERGRELGDVFSRPVLLDGVRWEKKL